MPRTGSYSHDSLLDAPGLGMGEEDPEPVINEVPIDPDAAYEAAMRGGGPYVTPQDRRGGS